VIGCGQGRQYLRRQSRLDGKFNSPHSQIWQQVSGALPSGICPRLRISTGPCTTRGGRYRKAFAISGAKLMAAPQSHSATQFVYPVPHQRVGERDVQRHRNGHTRIPTRRCARDDRANLAHELYNSNKPPAIEIISAPATNSSHPRCRRQGVRRHHAGIAVLAYCIDARAGDTGAFRLIALALQEAGNRRCDRIYNRIDSKRCEASADR